MENNHTINLAIQILPKSKTIDSYLLVDKAIEVIQNSGVRYMVCPFETVMEGEYQELIHIVEKARDAVFEAGADEMLINIKIQARKNSDVTILDKMEKY